MYVIIDYCTEYFMYVIQHWFSALQQLKIENMKRISLATVSGYAYALRYVINSYSFILMLFLSLWMLLLGYWAAVRVLCIGLIFYYLLALRPSVTQKNAYYFTEHNYTLLGMFSISFIATFVFYLLGNFLLGVKTLNDYRFIAISAGFLYIVLRNIVFQLFLLSVFFFMDTQGSLLLAIRRAVRLFWLNLPLMIILNSVMFVFTYILFFLGVMCNVLLCNVVGIFIICFFVTLHNVIYLKHLFENISEYIKNA